MRRVRALEDAVLEAAAAARWYELQRPGLGEEFERALEAAIRRLQNQIIPVRTLPGLPESERLRRLTLTRFPFDIVMVVTDDEVTIVALARHARRPGYWRGRVLR